MDAFGVASQGGGAGPAFKGHLLGGCGNGVEMIVEPDRVIAERFGFVCDASHSFVGFNRIGNVYQVHVPSLGNHYSVIHCHEQSSFLCLKEK